MSSDFLNKHYRNSIRSLFDLSLCNSWSFLNSNQLLQAFFQRSKYVIRQLPHAKSLGLIRYAHLLHKHFHPGSIWGPEIESSGIQHSSSNPFTFVCLKEHAMNGMICNYLRLLHFLSTFHHTVRHSLSTHSLFSVSATFLCVVFLASFSGSFSYCVFLILLCNFFSSLKEKKLPSFNLPLTCRHGFSLLLVSLNPSILKCAQGISAKRCERSNKLHISHHARLRFGTIW